MKNDVCICTKAHYKKSGNMFSRVRMKRGASYEMMTIGNVYSSDPIYNRYTIFIHSGITTISMEYNAEQFNRYFSNDIAMIRKTKLKKLNKVKV